MTMAARAHCKETKNEGENGIINNRIHYAMIFKFQLKLHRFQIFQTKYLFYSVCLSILLYDQEGLVSGGGRGLHVTEKKKLIFQ